MTEVRKNYGQIQVHVYWGETKTARGTSRHLNKVQKHKREDEGRHAGAEGSSRDIEAGHTVPQVAVCLCLNNSVCNSKYLYKIKICSDPDMKLKLHHFSSFILKLLIWKRLVTPSIKSQELLRLCKKDACCVTMQHIKQTSNLRDTTGSSPIYSGV